VRGTRNQTRVFGIHPRPRDPAWCCKTHAFGIADKTHGLPLRARRQGTISHEVFGASCILRSPVGAKGRSPGASHAERVAPPRVWPPTRTAAVRFRGYAPEKTVARKTQWLLDCLKADGIQATGVPFVAQYHPPWTPPFMRHNEVLVEVN
jgi:hypothetical protein